MSNRPSHHTRRTLLARSAAGLALAVPTAANARRLNMTNATSSPGLLLEDLDDSNRTSGLAQHDLHALRSIADWIRTYVVRPNGNIGRAGPVCPFVPRAWEGRSLWLAPERANDRDTQDIVELVGRYKSLLLNASPTTGDAAPYKSIVVVFSDLTPERAKSLFNDTLQQVAASSYGNDGVVIGAFYEGNDGTAIYNPSFHPFTAPVPFLLLRPAVLSDWKFFIDNERWLSLWARRYGDSAVQTLADEIRRLPWRAQRGEP